MIESGFFTSLIGFFIVLTPLIFFHELGHYYAARKSGVKVESFSIGFGPELFGYTDKNNTRWKFSLIPLGGYVKMKGELINLTKTSNTNSLESDTFLKANLFSRFLIVLSGPLANLFLGILQPTRVDLFETKFEILECFFFFSNIVSGPGQNIVPNFFSNLFKVKYFSICLILLK